MSNGMNLAQLIQAVYTETNRPDLIAQTQQAVFSSTLKMHGLDFFDKDILKAQAVFDFSAYLQELETTSMTRHRRMAYIRKDVPSIYVPYETNPTQLPPFSAGIDGSLVGASVARAMIDIIDPDDIFDDYGAEKVDIAYLAGTSLLIKSSTAFQFANIGWYAWPDCDIGNNGLNYFSWIAQEFPFAIVYDAASSILQKIGMTDAARKYDAVPPSGSGPGGGLVWSQIDMLIKSNVEHVGR